MHARAQDVGVFLGKAVVKAQHVAGAVAVLDPDQVGAGLGCGEVRFAGVLGGLLLVVGEFDDDREFSCGKHGVEVAHALGLLLGPACVFHDFCFEVLQGVQVDPEGQGFGADMGAEGVEAGGGAQGGKGHKAESGGGALPVEKRDVAADKVEPMGAVVFLLEVVQGFAGAGADAAGVGSGLGDVVGAAHGVEVDAVFDVVDGLCPGFAQPVAGGVVDGHLHQVAGILEVAAGHGVVKRQAHEASRADAGVEGFVGGAGAGLAKKGKPVAIRQDEIRASFVGEAEFVELVALAVGVGGPDKPSGDEHAVLVHVVGCEFLERVGAVAELFLAADGIEVVAAFPVGVGQGLLVPDHQAKGAGRPEQPGFGKVSGGIGKLGDAFVDALAQAFVGASDFVFGKAQGLAGSAEVSGPVAQDGAVGKAPGGLVGVQSVGHGHFDGEPGAEVAGVAVAARAQDKSDFLALLDVVEFGADGFVVAVGIDGVDEQRALVGAEAKAFASFGGKLYGKLAVGGGERGVLRFFGRFFVGRGRRVADVLFVKDRAGRLGCGARGFCVHVKSLKA